MKPPAFFSDVYRDLRDRHLLLPAVALLVGLVAVPFLLKGPDAPAVVPAPAPSPAADDSAITAAVLAGDSVGVRNYRKRLAELKATNPFKPQFEAPAADAETATDPGTQAASDPTATSGSTPTTPTGGASPPVMLPTDGNLTDGEQTDTTVEDDVTVDDEVVDEGGSGGNGGGGGGAEPSEGDVEVVEQLFTYRVDLAFGPVGDPKLLEGVKPMTILPDPANAVLAYLGTDEKGKRAAFVLSKDATVIAGDAACVPSPESCLYLALEKNETATLAYGPDQQTFNLRLLGIEDHPVS